MKNKRWHSYIWMIACIGSLLMLTPALGMAQAQEVDGYWERVGKVDIEKAPQPLNSTTTTTYTINSSSGTYRANLNGETFQASMTWTEPSQRYAGGESIDLTISVKIDEYIWNDDVPGYINEGLNYMGATISARIDEPDISYGGVTRGAVSLTDLQGEYSAKVSTDYGKIVVESQTLQVSAPFPSGGSDGDKKSIYVSCTAGMIRYNYQWVENANEEMEAPLAIPPEDSNPEPESEPTSGAPLGGVLGRIIVVVGIAIAGTLSTIAVELANKAAQAAASDKEEQPTEETVYVLNPSHKQFDLEVNQLVTLNVNGYRVNKEGHQLENDALISLSLPPDMTEYFNIQTTTSNGQLTAIITLLKIPSASSVNLDVNGIFPHGKAKAEVQLAFKMDFTISPVNSPNITYYEKDKQWRVPELIACFREPVQNTPIKVGFYYGFMDPPLTFEPDILEVKEGYSSDDGLTYNFKLIVRDGIDLETYFGEDLTYDDGRVKVKVEVKDEKGKKFTAKTELQVSPQLKMIACSYNKNVKTRGLRPTPYKGLELEEMEFIADGIDKLPLVIFFIRSDKEVTKGSEAEAIMDIVEVQKLEWSNTASFEEPEANSEKTGGGFFAYDLSSSGFIAADKDKVNGVYGLEVDARIRAGGPKNYSFEGNSMRFLVKPQFLKFNFWVVPGEYKGTSDAFAYVQLYPSKKAVPNMPLTLDVDNPSDSDRGFLKLMNKDREQNTCEPAQGERTYRSSKYIPLPKGSVCWGLEYSGMRWDNLSPSLIFAPSVCEFRVICTCTGPESDTGVIWQASQTINVGLNIHSLLSDLLSSADSPELKINNPYWKDSVIPYFIRGPFTNLLSLFVSEYETYVCKNMRDRIIDWLQNRSLYKKGDNPKKIESMFKMNGIDYEIYEIYGWHTWAGIFLSGSDDKRAKALDPWWEQRWDDPSLKDHENLITVYTEYTNLKLSEHGLSVRAVSTIIAGFIAFATLLIAILAPFGVTITLPAMITAMEIWLYGSVGAESTLNALGEVKRDETSGIYNPHNKRKKKYDASWFVYFIESFSKTND